MKPIIKPNLNIILEMASKFLNINGIFLDGKTGILPIVCAILGISFSASYFTFCVIGLIVYWESVESLSRAEGIPLSLKVFTSLMLTLYQKKQWAVIVSKVQLLNLHEKLNENERGKMDKTIKLYIKFSYIYSAQTIVAVIVFYVKAIYFLQLPLSLYTPCDVNNMDCYIPYLLYEIAMDCFMIPFPMGINLLYIYIVLAVVCEIEAFKCGIRKIHKGVTIKEISVLVEQHNRVSLIVDEFRKTGRSLFLIIYLTSMLLVCICFYMINRNGFPPNANDLTRYLPLAFMFIMEFYIYAYGANTLSESIESVADEVYNSAWPDIADIDVRKSLVLMIQKSQTTKHLTIGGLLIMDLAVFIKVMQNAFSFYTLMVNMGDNEMN